jgi:hypothetical protein
MKEFTAERVKTQTAAAWESATCDDAGNYRARYVGMDVHKGSIVIAVAEPGRSAPESRGEMANKP